jgi:hypothetical protein
MEKISNLSSNQFLIDMTNILDLDMISTERLDRLILNDYENYRNLIEGNQFMERSLIISNQASPILINTTLLLSEGEYNDDNNKNNIMSILNAKSTNIKFSNPVLEVEEATYDLAESLKIDLGKTIFKISSKISIKGKAKGVDILYLSNDDCQISLAGKDMSFRIKKAN